MKIAHVSDIHIRNLKYHDEYRRVFADFCEKLEREQVILVVNTGDTAHTKTQISPEFVDVTSKFLTDVAKIAPFVNVLGNHDLNLMNPERQDAMSPIVEALANENVHLWKKSGMYKVPGIVPFKFWNFGISDSKNWPKPPYPSDYINVGLFHGSIANCVTDSLFRMTHVEYDTDIFEGLDYVMMGDIHKRQSFNGGRIWYAGSMIQQNFGEELDKGFLVWDIEDKKKFDVKFVELKGGRKFHTVKLGDNLQVPDVPIEKGSRVRISPPRALTLVEQKTIEKIVKKKFEPHDVITLGVTNIGTQFVEVDDTKTNIESLRKLDVQERIIREYFSKLKVEVSEDVYKRLFEMNKRFQIDIEKKDELNRDVRWRFLKLGWSNFFNYGEGNVIDFSQVKGLTGIFAPNASGKSSMIDIMTAAAFDATTKGVAKNIHLINDNKDYALAIAEILANGERYVIERKIERIKYGQRSIPTGPKEWGKTTLSFSRVDGGVVEQMVEESRPDTERNIRRQLGTFDDFMLGHLMAQWNPLDLVSCRETERKRIFYRFLDLDIFEQKCNLAKAESRKAIDELSDLEENDYDVVREELKTSIAGNESALQSLTIDAAHTNALIDQLRLSIEELLSKKSAVAATAEDEEVSAQKCIERCDEEIADADMDIVKEKLEISKLSKEESDTKLLLEGFDPEKYQVDDDEIIELDYELRDLEKKISSLESSVKEKRRQIKILDQVPCGDKFPTCKYLIDAFDSKKTVEPVALEVEKYQKRRDEVAKQLGSMRMTKDSLEQFESFKRRLSSIGEKVSKHQLVLKNLELNRKFRSDERAGAVETIARAAQNREKIDENRKIEEQIAKNRAELRSYESYLESVRKRTSELERKIGSDQGKLDAVNVQVARLQELRQTCEAYERYAEAMGKDGIPLNILTQKLPLVNEEINKILGQTTEFGVFIEHDPVEQSIRFYLQYGQYKSRLLELGSGAEKFLASLAIRAALISISNLPKTNMFVIDEGFGKLDPTYMESVQRMFDYLKSVYDHVIVISHTDLMKDMVDNIVDITSDEEGYAHVEVGS